MRIDNVPVSIGTQNVDPIVLAFILAVLVGGFLFAQKSPRLFLLLAVTAAGIGGGLLLGR